MKTHGPLEEFKAKNEIELWLITCIRYFIYLYSRYGCDALYVYNAGERAYLRNKIPDVTYRYKYNIKNYVLSYSDMLYKIAHANYKTREMQRILNLIEDVVTKQKEKESLKENILSKIIANQDKSSLHNNSIGINNNDLAYDPKKRFIMVILLRYFSLQSTIDEDKEIEYALNKIK
jgi:hypothetical protein